MRQTVLLLFTFISGSCLAQVSSVPSQVYNWRNLPIIKEETRDRRQMIDGSTSDLASLEIHTSTLEPGKAPHGSHTHSDEEELIIVKEGKLRATIKDQTKILGPGSIALAIPGEEHGFVNGGDTKTTYYILKFKSKTPLNAELGKNAGGSFMIDWNDVTMVASEKGGRRNTFDRATSMFGRFEMHVTTLNKGLVSHAPHQHKAAEIIILIKGQAEMQIGDQHIKFEPGDLAFLESQSLHALKNVGDEPCEYFAFQWQ
jgi:(S)-ureidoglycine aminohydrolase